MLEATKMTLSQVNHLFYRNVWKVATQIQYDRLFAVNLLKQKSKIRETITVYWYITIDFKSDTGVGTLTAQENGIALYNLIFDTQLIVYSRSLARFGRRKLTVLRSDRVHQQRNVELRAPTNDTHTRDLAGGPPVSLP